MAHVLDQIRDAFAEVLVGADGVTTVTKGRRSAFLESELPAANVLSIAEDIDYETVHDPAVQLRRGRITVEVLAATIDDVEPTLFAAQAGIEVAIATDPTLGDLVEDMRLLSSDPADEPGDEGEYTTERRVLAFSFQTATVQGAPDTVIL